MHVVGSNKKPTNLSSELFLGKKRKNDAEKLKSFVSVNGHQQNQDKIRVSSSAELNKISKDRLFHVKHVKHCPYPKSATFQGRLSARTKLNVDASAKATSKTSGFRGKHFVSFEGTKVNVLEDVFYYGDYSPAESEPMFITSPVEPKTTHDFKTIQVLQTEFSSSSKSTRGLPRAVSPVDTQSLKRYCSLIHHAIDCSVVAPLPQEWIEKTYEFIPEELKQRFPTILDDFTQVCPKHHTTPHHTTPHHTSPHHILPHFTSSHLPRGILVTI